MLSLLLTFAAQDPWSQKFDYQTVAAPLSKIVAELTKKTGVHLETSGDCSRDLVVMSVHDMTLKQLLPKLAKLDDCEWRLYNETFILSHKPRYEAKWLQDHVAFKQNWISKAVAKLKIEKEWGAAKIVEELKALKQDAEQSELNSWELMRAHRGINKLAAGSRLTARLLQMIPARDIASIPDEYTLRFSPTPTPLQTQIASESLATLATYNEEFEVQRQAIASVGNLGREEFGWYFRLLRDSDSLTRPVEHLVIDVGENWGGYRVNASLFDKSGKFIRQENEYLAQFSFEDYLDNAKKIPKIIPDTPEAVVFHLSDFSKAVRDERYTWMRQTSAGKEKDAVLAFLRDPVANESLSLATSEMWLLYAKTFKKNLIGILTDDMDMGYYSDGISLGLISQGSYFNQALTIATDSDWVTVVPKDRYESERQMFPRQLVKNLIDEGLATQTMSLDSLAQLALSTNELTFSSSLEQIGAAVQKGGIGNNSYGSSLDVLKFYGGLDSIKKKQLEGAGVTIDYQLLNPSQKKIINHLVLYQDLFLTKIRKDEPTSNRESSFAISSSMDGGMYFGGGGNSDYQDLPTVAFARGFPRGTLIQLKFDQKPVILGRASTSDYNWVQQFSAESLGQTLAFQELRKRSGSDDDYGSTFNEFALATNKTLQMTIDFGGVYSAAATYRLADTVGVPKYGSFKGLPQALRDEIQKAYWKSMSEYANMQFRSYSNDNGRPRRP